MSHAVGVTASPRRDVCARVEDLQRQLTEQLESFESANDWRRLLDLASRFHRYSINNLILIALQHAAAYECGQVPTGGPTYAAGFHTWKSLGRTVDKGQKGYAILAPVPTAARIAAAGNGPSATRRLLIRGEEPRSGEHLELEQRLGWKIAHVFDVTQTTGEPLPDSPRPRPLAGAAPDGLIDELTRIATATCFAVGYADDRRTIGGADGLTRFGARTVTRCAATCLVPGLRQRLPTNSGTSRCTTRGECG